METFHSASLLEPRASRMSQMKDQTTMAFFNRFKYETYSKPQEATRSVQDYRSMAKTVITGAFFMDATLPVDRIYALHSMLVMYGLPLPEPDYNKALEVVYEETVWAWIQR